MRRKDREITDKSEIIKIIEKCDACRLGLSQNNVPYIVPLNFGFLYENDVLTLYFHGAGEGKKLDIIKENPIACFEMDCSHKLVEADEAARYSMEYESVIGSGIITICTNKDEKVKALTQIMNTYVKDKEFVFPDNALNAVTVLKLTVNELTGKSLKKT